MYTHGLQWLQEALECLRTAGNSHELALAQARRSGARSSFGRHVPRASTVFQALVAKMSRAAPQAGPGTSRARKLQRLDEASASSAQATRAAAQPQSQAQAQNPRLTERGPQQRNSAGAGKRGRRRAGHHRCGAPNCSARNSNLTSSSTPTFRGSVAAGVLVNGSAANLGVVLGTASRPFNYYNAYTSSSQPQTPVSSHDPPPYSDRWHQSRLKSTRWLCWHLSLPLS